MAVPKDALTNIRARDNAAIQYPTNFQITEAIKLTRLAVPGVQQEIDPAAQTATFGPMDRVTVDAFVSYIYGLTEMVAEVYSQDEGWYFTISMFQWSDRE